MDKWTVYTYIQAAFQQWGTSSTDTPGIFFSYTYLSHNYSHICIGTLRSLWYFFGRNLQQQEREKTHTYYFKTLHCIALKYNIMHQWSKQNHDLNCWWHFSIFKRLLPTFTSFTGESIIVVSRGSVSTHQAKFFLLSRHGPFLFLSISTAICTKSTRRRKIFPSYNYRKKSFPD